MKKFVVERNLTGAGNLSPRIVTNLQKPLKKAFKEMGYNINNKDKFEVVSFLALILCSNKSVKLIKNKTILCNTKNNNSAGTGINAMKRRSRKS